MADLEIDRQRAANLWESFARKHPPFQAAAQLEPAPDLYFDSIGGLAEPKEEILTYACAATDPEVYVRWGTAPPTGLLLIGPPESGKALLARALATSTGTPFLEIRVPRLVLQLLHAPQSAAELMSAWLETIAEMPRLTTFFHEVDFSRVHSVIGRRPDAQAAPVMDFVIEFIDRTIDLDSSLVVGSTSHADSMAPLFVEPGRFERVVEVNPVVPDDVVDALRIHASKAEARAGRELFGAVDWASAVERAREASIGEWVRLLNGVLRRKARCEAAGEAVQPVTTEDVMVEVERFRKTSARLPPGTGSYL
jgi:ATP-dependent 26S proteasome regulatory subunit